MKIEIYIPEYEVEVIAKVAELKKKRKLSAYIVELLKNGGHVITEARIIELIKKHATEEHKNTTSVGGLEDSIQSILDGFNG